MRFVNILSKFRRSGVVSVTLSCIILLFAVASTSCTRSGDFLQPGGELSKAERQSITAIHPGFARWSPSQSTTWVRHGIISHVCINECGIGSITMPYEIIVFDAEGKVVEMNIIQAPNPSGPKAVVSISPLRIEFEMTGSRTMICGTEYSQGEGQIELKKQMEKVERWWNVHESWKQSGSTNQEVLWQMLRDAETNSNK